MLISRTANDKGAAVIFSEGKEGLFGSGNNFWLIVLSYCSHNAQMCTALISLMAFTVALSENTAEIKLSSQSFAHTFHCCCCCPAQTVRSQSIFSM